MSDWPKGSASYLRDMIDNQARASGMSSAEFQRQLEDAKRALEQLHAGERVLPFTGRRHSVTHASAFFGIDSAPGDVQIYNNTIVTADRGFAVPSNYDVNPPEPKPKTPAENHASFVSRFLEHGADAL